MSCFIVYVEASGRTCQLPRGQEAFYCLSRTSSARGRGCHVLWVAIEDNECVGLHASHFNSSWPDEEGEDRAMSFFTSSLETIKRMLIAKKLETADFSLLHLRIWRDRPSVHARHCTLGTAFLWSVRSTGTRVTKCPCTRNVDIGIPDLRVRIFSKKKTDGTVFKGCETCEADCRDLFLFGREFYSYLACFTDCMKRG